MEEKSKRGDVTFLVNPRAANSKWLRRKKLRAYLENKLPGTIHDVIGDARTTAERARDASATSEVIVAMGGDGTIADTLKGIFDAGKNESILFGVIPFGSGNAFRKAFGIPKDPRRAIDCLSAGVARPIDVIETEGRIANFASVGATARVTGEKYKNPVPGFWGFLLAARKLFGTRLDEKVIDLYDGRDRHGPFEHKTVRSPFFDLVVAKTNYYGYSWYMAPRARVDDGYLDITLFEVGPIKYILLLPVIYFGFFQRRQRHFKARRAVISGQAMPIQYNGEFLGDRDRVEFRVLPKAIRMICPPGRRGRKRFESPD
ncbi:MAG TPA: diacylglycerol kinase family protein [Terriglobales bacterium]|nr:diacylglycerol kinase family protein [Terriglobales bacterium]